MTDSTMAASGAAPGVSATAPPVSTPSASSPANIAAANSTTFAIILSLSFCHLLNDMMQSLVPALYPILKDSYDLSFSQIGLITLAFQCTASMLQPLVGLYTDKRPQPYSLAFGMGFTLVGLLIMSRADSYPVILAAAALAALAVPGTLAARLREYQPPTWNSTIMAIRAAAENQTMLCWPCGTTMKAASSGPEAEPILPPTWKSDWARP